jgi:hypothetical protein
MWQAAMEEELAGMRERRAFTMVAEPALPASARPVDLRCVFNVKTTDGGEFDRCKVRLVAKGFKQRYGIDYKETVSQALVDPLLSKFFHQGACLLPCMAQSQRP